MTVEAVVQQCARSLADVAHTIIVVDDHSDSGCEARDAEFLGSYTRYFVCPPGTDVETLDLSAYRDSHVQVEHEGQDCTLVAVLYF